MVALSSSACLSSDDDTAVAALAISITSPSQARIDTTDTAIDIAGNADSDSEVVSVIWENDRGGSGTAEGTAKWQATAIPLELGVNTISVTASDIDGDSTAATMVVNRESTGKGSVTLSWNAPTERTDGTALTDLAGYRIYYGRMSEVYDYEIDVESPGILTYVVEDLVPGEWYFVAAAYDSDGNESDYSNEVSRTVL